MTVQLTAMRDGFLSGLYDRFCSDEKLFFLTADFGAPALDKMRMDFPERVLNVGISEQNLINVATGLSLEGYTVFAYAIAPFITMRCYEQIRVNLAILSQTRKIKVNLIGVGAGISYVVSGPTHHCLEDISVMGTLPNMEIISPSDAETAALFIDFSTSEEGVRYFRFDARPQPSIHGENIKDAVDSGYVEMFRGGEVCIVSTGVMTHTALMVQREFLNRGVNVGLVDLIRLRKFNRTGLYDIIKNYRAVITLEEAFSGKGGVDSVIALLLRENHSNIRMEGMGLPDRYMFDIGSRDYLHKISGLDSGSIIKKIDCLIKK